MDKEQRDQKKFLEEQLNWSKEQISILDEINSKLHEMKTIAVYALENHLTPSETENLNTQLNLLKEEVHVLEKQLHHVIH